MSHNYGYDLNRIIFKANELGNSQLEGYALQLDSLVAENDQTPELQNFLDKTIEFLYGIIEG